MMQTYVQYGDLIVFEHNSYQNNLVKKGYISATGFIDKNLYIFQSKNSMSFQEQKKSIPLNFRSFVFQITPKLYFDYHKDYAKAKKKYHQILKKNEISDLLKKKIDKLEKKMMEENLLNEKVIRKMKKKFVKYGEEIQLMHFDSKSFIIGKNDYEKNDMIGYNCKLLEGYSSSMIFQIQPKFKTNQIGDKIHYHDTIYLKNVIFNSFINFKEEFEEYEYFSTALSKNLAVHNWVDPNYEKKKIFLSQERDCVFSLKLFKKNIHSTQQINGFDLVFLEHTELQSLLTADAKYLQGGQREEFVYLRKYKGDISEEAFNLDSIWIVEPFDIENISEKIEVSSYQKNEEQVGQLRLRHFSTGKLMGFVEIEGSENAILGKNEDIIYFKSLENSQFLTNSQLYYIVKAKNECIFQAITQNKKNSIDFQSLKNKVIDEQNQQRNIQVEKLQDEDLEIVKTGVFLSPVQNQENVFKIKKVHEDKIKKILFVQSGILKLRIFLDKFIDKKILKDTDLIKTQNIIQIIIKFIFQLDEEEEVDYFNIDLEPIQENQKILRDLHFLDILIEIFYLAFSSYDIQNFNLGENQDQSIEKNELVLNFIKISFSAMRYTIKEYRPNELYASQWLQFLMNYTLETQEKCDTLIGLTLTELIDNNTKILESRITMKTIETIIQGMKFDTTNLYFINLLRAICICNKKPMFFNQKVTSNILLKEIVYKARGFSFFEGSEGKIMIENEDQMNKFVKELFEMEEQEDKRYPYILKFCQLISDLCKDRNYNAIQFVQNKFPKLVLLKIIKNGAYSYHIREVVLNMFENIWMDREPYQFRENPSVVIMMEVKLEENLQNLAQNDFDFSFEELRGFLWEYLEELQPEPDLSKIKFSIKVLDIIIKMIHIEFIHKTEEFKRLIKLILRVLDIFSQQKNIQFQAPITSRNSNSFDISQKNLYAFFIKIFRLVRVILKFQVSSSYKNLILDYKNKTTNNQKNLNLKELVKPKVIINKLKKLKDLDEKEKFAEIYRICLRQNKIQIFDQNDLNKLVFIALKFIIHSKYNDLLKNCLKLIDDLFKQNQFLISYFENISLIYNQEHFDSFKKLKKEAKKLFEQQDNIEDWYVNDKIYKLDEQIKELNIFIDTHQKIIFKVPFDELTQELISFQIAFDKNIKMSYLQKLYDNLNIIANLFKILRYDIYITKKNGDNLRINQTLNKIYQLIYFYQKDNFHNKQIICDNYMSIVLEHFNQNIFYAVILLKDLITDNKKIIFDFKKNNFIDKLLSMLNNEQQKPILQLIILKIFQSFLDYRGYKIKKQQIFFAFKLLKMSLFININNFLKSILFSEEESYFLKLVIQRNSNLIYVDREDKANEKNLERVFLLNDKFNLFLVMMNTIQFCLEKNAFVKNLCKGLMVFKEFIEIYKFISFEKGFPLKIAMLKYLKFVLLENNEEDNQLFENISEIWGILNSDYQQLEIFLQNQKENLDILVITFDNFTNFKQLFEQYFGLFLDSLLFIVYVFRFQNDKGNQNDILCMKNTMKAYGNSLNILLSEFKIDNRKHLDLLFRVENLILYKNSLKKKLEQKIVKNSESLKQQFTLNINFLNKKSFIDFDQSIDLKQKKKLEELLRAFSETIQFEDIQANEYNYLIHLLINLDKFPSEEAEFTLKQLIHSLLEFIQEEKKNEHLVNITTKLIRSILQIDSGFHGEVILSEIEEEDLENYNAIIARQNSISDLGIAAFVCNLLKEDFQLETKKNLLLTAVNYLYKGNQKIQTSFLEYFQQDVKQEKVEIFHLIAKLLESCFQKVKKGIVRRNKENLREYYKISHAHEQEKKSLEAIKSEIEQFDTNFQVCKLIYKFFQLLCEGHNLSLQNFLRKQGEGEEFHNINMVEMVVDHWGQLIKFLNVDSCALGQCILEFLIECIEGPCYENQLEVYNRKIVEHSKDFMRDFRDSKECSIKGFSKEEGTLFLISDLISLNIKLLNTLIEANDDINVYQKMGQKIAFDLLMEKLCEYYEQFKQQYAKYFVKEDFPLLPKNAFKGNIAEAFNIMKFIRMIDFKTKIYASQIEKLDQIQQKAYCFFYKNTGHIEIIYENKIFLLFFTIQPVCRLSPGIKNAFMSSISIETPFDKLNGMISNSTHLFEQLDYLNKLKITCRLFSLDIYRYLLNLSIFIIYFINVLMIFYLVRQIKGNQVEIIFVNDDVEKFTKILAIFNMILLILQDLLWVVMNSSIIISTGFQEKYMKLKKKLQAIKDPSDQVAAVKESLRKSFLSLTLKEKLKIIELDAQLDGYTNVFPLIELIFQTITYILMDQQCAYTKFLIVLQYIAIFKNQLIFFCVPLFTIIVIQKDSLQNSLKCYQINYLSQIFTFNHFYQHYYSYIFIKCFRIHIFRSHILYL